MEFNKIAAAILLAGIIGMVAGKVTDILYHGGGHHGAEHADVKRGYSIDVPEGADTAGGAPAEAEIASVLHLLKGADVAAGDKLFHTKCTTCHTIGKGEAAKTGPNLWGVLGHPHASFAGFKYSKAMEATKGKVWDFDALNHFVAAPKKYIPGTIMSFPGLKKEQERADLLAYMNTQTDKPIPVPDAPPPAANDEAVEKPGSLKEDAATGGEADSHRTDPAQSRDLEKRNTDPDVKQDGPSRDAEGNPTSKAEAQGAKDKAGAGAPEVKGTAKPSEPPAPAQLDSQEKAE